MRYVIRFVLLLFLLAVVGVSARTAHAYALTGAKWPQPGGLGTTVELTYSFENMFDGGLLMPNGQPLPNLLIRQSIEEALRLWSSAAPLVFREVPDDGLNYNNGAAQYGQIRFRHISLNGTDPEIGLPIAKAQAYYPAGGILGGDVEFDHFDRWQKDGTLSQPDILGAAIHEIGHTLGLDHSSITQPGVSYTYKNYDGLGNIIDVELPKGNANMYWVFNRLTGPGSGFLFQDDIDGIRAIYGTGTGAVFPIAVPEPSALVLALLCGATGFVGRRRRK